MVAFVIARTPAFVTLALFLTALLPGTKEPDRVSIKIQKGAIVCTVPRHPENRGLTFIIPEQLSHFVQLDGAEARITHRLDIPRTIECSAEEPDMEAYCILQTSVSGQEFRAHAPFLCPHTD